MPWSLPLAKASSTVAVETVELEEAVELENFV